MWNSGGLPAGGVDARERDASPRERHGATTDLLHGDEPARTALCRFDRDIEAIVQPRGREEVDLDAVDDERDARTPASGD